MERDEDVLSPVQPQLGRLTERDLTRLSGGNEKLAEILRFCNSNMVIAVNAQAKTADNYVPSDYEGKE